MEGAFIREAAFIREGAFIRINTAVPVMMPAISILSLNKYFSVADICITKETIQKAILVCYLGILYRYLYCLRRYVKLTCKYFTLCKYPVNSLASAKVIDKHAW